jgi:hypothetical protein
VAGAAFAYAPWRTDQVVHLNVLSSGGIPLALFLLVRGYRTGRAGAIVAGWLVASWQLSLGFTLGLQLVYLLGALALVAAVAWLRRGRPRPPRPVTVASVAGVAVFAAAGFALSRPFVAVLDEHPEVPHPEHVVARYSPPPRSYLAASPSNPVWGAVTAGVRSQLPEANEQTLFPGALTLVLAGVGLLATTYPRALRIGLALGAAGCGLLALGLRMEGSRFPLEPYRLLHELAPGWEGVRTPGRLTTLTSLALALLAGAGARAALGRLRRWRPSRPGLVAPAAVGLVAVVLAEGSGFAVGREGSLIAGPPHTEVPDAPPGQRGAPAPQLHLPIDFLANQKYLLWSTIGYPLMTNGIGAFTPDLARQLEQVRTPAFPDRGSVRFLRRLGVRTVVLHTDLARGTLWAGAAKKPVEGLSLRRERRGALVLYHLRPRRAAGQNAL